MTRVEIPRFFIVQRCAYYGKWPEFVIAGGSPSRLNDDSHGASNLDLRAWFISYKNRSDFGELQEEFSGDVIPILSIEKNVGFWSGNQNYIENAVGETLFGVKLNNPKTGEVDLLVSLHSDSGIDRTQVFTILAPYIFPLVLHMSSILGEVLVPTQPIVVYEHVGGNFEALSQNDQVRVNLLTRPSSQVPVIIQALDAFAKQYTRASRQKVETLSVASRRIMSARTETDLVDRFCDLWEACEFLTHAKKKTPVIRISVLLEAISGYKARDLQKYIIIPIYKIRCDLVHNATEDAAKCQKAVEILDHIASVMFAHISGLSVKIGPIFADTMDKCLKARSCFV